jgi:predicted nucleotidyltransferase
MWQILPIVLSIGEAQSSMFDDQELLIKEIAAILKSMGAREVFLFGSYAEGTAREDSDIDLAVSGIPPRQFFKAMGEVGDRLNRSFDLIDLDEDSPFTRYLKEEGGLKAVG